MQSAVDTYRYLLTLHKTNDGPKGRDDYDSPPNIPNRDFVLQAIRRRFDWILVKAGLKTAPGDELGTLYSLGHTSIMFRLTKGGHIDLLTRARNARASIGMIDRFYARPISGEMNVEMHQSMRVAPTTPSV